MRNPMRRFWGMLVLIALLAPACSRPDQPGNTGAGPAGHISVAGSTTVQPLAERLAEDFRARFPQVNIDVQDGGSSVGVKSAGQGTVEVGMASRELKDTELKEYPTLKAIPIALDGIALVTHPVVPVSSLSKEQVRGIFSGQITNWSQVGGPQQSIFIVSREEGSGTRTAFEDLAMGQEVISARAIFMPSNGAIRTTIATTPYAIGFLSFGYLDQSVKALAVNGVEPTEANAASGKYPLVRPLNFLTQGEPSGLVKAWLDFIFSPEGQQVVTTEGYISVK